MPKPVLAALALLVSVLRPLCANAQEAPSLPHQQWSFDGIFGTSTKKAVESCQSDNGLTADGVVGPKTRAALGI